MSLTPFFQNVSLSVESMKWIQTCVDPNEIKQALDLIMYWKTNKDCDKCGSEYTIGELRWDESDPYSSGDELVCRNCWESYNYGTVFDPSYRPPSWPLARPPIQSTVPVFDGIIMCNGIRVGTVKKYNSKGHSGFVTLDAYQSQGGEWGDLERDHIVSIL